MGAYKSVPELCLTILSASLVFGAPARGAALERPAAQQAQTVSSVSAAPSEGQVPVQVAWIGADSRIDKPRCVMVTTEEAWSSLWHEHKGTTPTSGPHGDLEVPRVNFATCLVVAVFQGKASNSSGLATVSVNDEKDRILVRVDDLSYQTLGPGGGGVQVSAYGIFVLPRILKPWTVEEDVQGMIGQPPKWKERARFKTPQSAG